MKPYSFRTIITSDGPKGYHGFVPILRGVHTHGKTVQETQKNLKEAIKCHLQGLCKDRKTIPKEEDTFESIQSFSEKEFYVTK